MDSKPIRTKEKSDRQILSFCLCPYISSCLLLKQDSSVAADPRLYLFLGHTCYCRSPPLLSPPAVSFPNSALNQPAPPGLSPSSFPLSHYSGTLWDNSKSFYSLKIIKYLSELTFCTQTLENGFFNKRPSSWVFLGRGNSII